MRTQQKHWKKPNPRTKKWWGSDKHNALHLSLIFLHVIECCCCCFFSRDSHEAALSKRLEVQVELLNNYGEHQNWRILNCFTHYFIFSFKKPKTMQRKHTIQFQKLQRKRWIKWYKKGLLFYLDFWLTVLPENFARHPYLVAFLGLFYRQTTLLLVYL